MTVNLALRAAPLLVWITWSVARAAADTFAADRAALEARVRTSPDDPPALLALGKLLHNRSTLELADARETAKAAEKHLRHLLAVRPTNAFGRALLGSTITLGARDAFLPTTKLRLVKRGLAEMDAAVTSAPEDLNARFTRAANNVYLPDLFGRREVVLMDFAALEDAARKRPADFDESFRQYVALYHGIARRRNGELDKARELWQAGLAINPDSPVARLIREEQTRKDR